MNWPILLILCPVVATSAHLLAADSPPNPWDLVKMGGEVAIVGGFLWYLMHRDRDQKSLVHRTLDVMERSASSIEGLTTAVNRRNDGLDRLVDVLQKRSA